MDPFEAFLLAGVKLKNRIIRSATHEGLADEAGFPTLDLQKTYLRLAQGGVGAIITGYAGVAAGGKSPLYRMLMIDRDECVPSYRKLVEAVHGHNVPIFLQVAHCGRQTSRRVTGCRPVAPSALRDGIYSDEVPRALEENEIRRIIGDFVQAVLRAKAAGFDGVQLHAAHGYLLSGFLSPYMNRRTDAWGGSTENRFRMVGEIYRELKTRAAGYPVFIKINGHDNRPGGMRAEEAAEIARLLEQAGCAGIEVSCGVLEEGFSTAPPEADPMEAVFHYHHKAKGIPAWLKFLIRPALRRRFAPKTATRMYNIPAARAIKAAVSIPVIAVGGIKTLADIRRVLAEGSADVISMCRPLIMEPNLVGKFRSGRQTAARCMACDYCVLAAEAEPLRCHFGRIEGREAPG